MGTLGGHVLPGSIFLFLAVWWSFITSIRYAKSKMKSPYKKNSLVGYRTTISMPCICLPCASLRRAPIESYIKLLLTGLGLLGEIITGLKYTMIAAHELTEHNHLANHTSDGDSHSHHMSLRETTEMVKVWHFEHGNAQHITMYAAFILASIVEIMVHHGVDLPKKLDFVTNIFGFIIEDILFIFHLHGKDAIEVHLHVLLILAITGCVLCSCLEVYDDRQILFTYGRILFTLVQGTWFCHVGFILYPPYDWPSLKWNSADHYQIMLVTMFFCWHIMIVMSLLIFLLKFIGRIYESGKFSSSGDELILLDHSHSDNFRKSKFKNYDSKFLTINSDDESGDEQIAYDGTKIIKTQNLNQNDA